MDGVAVILVVVRRRGYYLPLIGGDEFVHADRRSRLSLEPDFDFVLRGLQSRQF